MEEGGIFFGGGGDNMALLKSQHDLDIIIQIKNILIMNNCAIDRFQSNVFM